MRGIEQLLVPQLTERALPAVRVEHSLAKSALVQAHARCGGDGRAVPRLPRRLARAGSFDPTSHSDRYSIKPATLH